MGCRQFDWILESEVEGGQERSGEKELSIPGGGGGEMGMCEEPSRWRGLHCHIPEEVLHGIAEGSEGILLMQTTYYGNNSIH